VLGKRFAIPNVSFLGNILAFSGFYLLTSAIVLEGAAIMENNRIIHHYKSIYTSDEVYVIAYKAEK
jgi:hypothetical protein